jgi:hypothetical protein
VATQTDPLASDLKPKAKCSGAETMMFQKHQALHGTQEK